MIGDYIDKEWADSQAEVKGPCPHPGKRRHGNKETAEFHMFNMWRKGRGTRLICRVYLCQCGVWHTTKKPLSGRERGEQ